MQGNDWPLWDLRTELLQALDAHYQAAEGSFPPILPSGLLSLLNDVGPALGREYLAVIEALLDDMYQRGMVARIPPLSACHSAWYMSRESALMAISWQAPVMLMPLRDGAKPPR